MSITTRDQLRGTILDGIGQILARPAIRWMLSADQLAVLETERSYYGSEASDASLDAMLKILPTVQVKLEDETPASHSVEVLKERILDLRQEAVNMACIANSKAPGAVSALEINELQIAAIEAEIDLKLEREKR